MDIFVRDTQTEQTTCVSVASDGTEANDDSFGPAISGNDRYVAFMSSASNLLVLAGILIPRMGISPAQPGSKAITWFFAVRMRTFELLPGRSC